MAALEADPNVEASSRRDSTQGTSVVLLKDSFASAPVKELAVQTLTSHDVNPPKQDAQSTDLFGDIMRFCCNIPLKAYSGNLQKAWEPPASCSKLPRRRKQGWSFCGLLCSRMHPGKKFILLTARRKVKFQVFWLCASWWLH